MQIDGKTRLYGIMGKPVSHSLSPAMHNTAFQHLGLNNIYVAFEVEDVARALDGFRALGVCGVSVTIPHKQAVIPHLDAIDPVAEKIGAVNTLAINDRQIQGSNTDWVGAMQALETITELSGQTVLVIGAGGSARAVGFGLREKGAKILLANRTLSRGQDLARDLGCECIPLTELGDVRADAMINTTSVGMIPNDADTPVPAALLENVAAVMDIVYSPVVTRLLREAKQAGCRAIDGRYMLLYQGVAQFELWTGQKAPVDVMRTALFSRLSQ
ncbi:MAG: shikimate dehydrogenase [Deltaproteobacteria bacterium SG8_13]|nr:MAG: shikimate dehydrogenase [Deltaproteobacteria bacterium SG8_13]